MKLVFGILVFSLCITTSSLSRAQEPTLPPPSLTPPAAASEPAATDTLDKTYVQLEVTPNNPADMSILKTLQGLLRVLQAAKYYSLLNWETFTRRNLDVEAYSRVGHFGRWINDPNDDTCYNTRARVLVRDSDREVIFKDKNHCAVESGSWNDPYTGRVFTSTLDIQIDHVVPLKNAYMSGAYKWNFKSRCLYANYMGNNCHLLSVNGTENMRKGDKGPDRYMPPNPAHTCVYLKNWLSIKFLWGLRMTSSEAGAISQLIKDNHCNLNNFRMTDAEVLGQQRFAREHIDMCPAPAAAQ